jgi:hypothetical protein
MPVTAVGARFISPFLFAAMARFAAMRLVKDRNSSDLRERASVACVSIDIFFFILACLYLIHDPKVYLLD